jgi:hypothetical protein
MKYSVLSNASLEKLITDVNAYIKDGWIPQGGIAYGNYVYHRNHHGDAGEVTYTYCQAMIKNEDKS